MSLQLYSFEIQDPFAEPITNDLGESDRPLTRVIRGEYAEPPESLRPQVCPPRKPLLASFFEQLAQLENLHISSKDDKFHIHIDVQHFAPDELSVTVVNGYVVAEGKHNEKVDEHGNVSRHFVRKFALPQGCLPDTVEAQVSSDGVLTISAPTVLPLPSIGERIIPIKLTGPVDLEPIDQPCVF